MAKDVEIDEEVDVIISEWMGYMLLYESMLGSVINARDRWLKRGGLILPSNATLYMAPVTHLDRYSESIDFWRNVYGIDMSAMLPLAKQCTFEEPLVETITGENVLTWPHVVKHMDCYTVQIHELQSSSLMGMLSEAYTLFSEAFAILQQVTGPLHREVANCCRYLAMVLYHVGDMPGAIMHQHEELWDYVFSVDGAFLITASSDKKAKLWSMSSSSLLVEVLPFIMFLVLSSSLLVEVLVL